jgi:Domain of Unknown Function (DUF1080).
MKKFLPLACLLLARAFAADPNDGLPAPELTEVWSPVPPVVSAPANAVPSDAIVLFDGKNLDAWESLKKETLGQPAPWTIEGDALVVAPKTGDIRTKASFGDVQLHIEWRSPAKVVGKSQGRGNSGVFFMGQYELQVLDSYDNETYPNGQAASVYKQHIPLVNASRPPGEWQTYDVVFIAPRFNADGTLRSPARMTVFHNGVLAQYDVELQGATVWRGKPSYKAHPAKLPIHLQDHGNPVAFRNIWVREITLRDTP